MIKVVYKDIKKKYLNKLVFNESIWNALCEVIGYWYNLDINQIKNCKLIGIYDDTEINVIEKEVDKK